jgi:hypothetical protein
MGTNCHKAYLGNGELSHRQGEIHAQRHDNVDANIGQDRFGITIKHW